MGEILFHNTIIRGVGILLIPEIIFLILMIRHRKPGASLVNVFDPTALTGRGLRAKKGWDIVTTAAVVWIFVGMIVGAAKLWWS